MGETRHLNGKIVLRPHDDGSFDELLLMDGKECIVHMEMMDDNRLWIGLYPEGAKPHERFVVNISARGKLSILAEED